ncbi:MAG: glycosyltransferase [Sphingomonadales bacterium]
MAQKIVFLINSLTGGGAERVMATLLRHSETLKGEADVHLVLLDDEPRAYSVPSWVRLTQLNAQGSLLKSYVQTRRLFKQLRPDLCLSFLTRSNVVNALLQPLGHHVIMSERVNTSAHLGTVVAGQFARFLVRKTYPTARAVICVSSGVAEDLIANFGVDTSRTHTIANPIDAEAIARRAHCAAQTGAPSRPYYVAMGRFVETKNFGLLLTAFAKADLDADLVLLGDGPLRPALEAQIQALKLDDRISLPGFQDNPFPIIQRARAFVLSSNAEGFPNALVEAMSLSVPVIATNCASGPSEILAHCSRETISFPNKAAHGLLIPCNDPAALANALEMLENQDRRCGLAKQAHLRARDFTPDKAAHAYWQVVHDALEAA